MRLRTIARVIAGALLAQACGGQATTPSDVPSRSAEPITFSGRVLEYRTEAPIASAEATISLQFPTLLRAMTDAEGRYALTVPRAGTYAINVNGKNAGTLHVTGDAFRGDLYVDTTTCIARYGLILDGKTRRPVSGATVTLGSGTTSSGPDGWYRRDLGCPAMVLPGNTTWLDVAHPDYESRSVVVGRGVSQVLRTDVALVHR
jgi:hypothetical protein